MISTYYYTTDPSRLTRPVMMLRNLTSLIIENILAFTLTALQIHSNKLYKTGPHNGIYNIYSIEMCCTWIYLT